MTVDEVIQLMVYPLSPYPYAISTLLTDWLTGTGSHSNPLTAASAPGEFDQCEILYIPYLRKYVIIEDTCAKCSMSVPPLSLSEYMLRRSHQLENQATSRGHLAWTNRARRQCGSVREYINTGFWDCCDPGRRRSI